MISGLNGKPGGDTRKLLRDVHIRGFTVCPPCGEITQGEIKTGISDILEPGLPTALCQSPQVVLNEVAPENFRRSRVTVPNLILSKDSSREDKVAQSPVERAVYSWRGICNSGSVRNWK